MIYWPGLDSEVFKMKNFFEGVKTFLAEEEGLTIVEYAIGGALVAAGAVLAFSQLGTAVCETIDELENAVKGSTAVGKCPPTVTP